MTHKLMLIGEAFGEAEEKAGLPFVGPTGRVLDSILEEVGIPRAMCYITNVVNERPENNNFEIYYDGKKPTPKLLENYQRLYDEIAAVSPNLIVCLGSEATKAVCGSAYASIMHWRGSIIQTTHGKAMPTIHPAAILREWTFRPAVICDMIRAAQEMEFPEIRRMPRELVVSYDFNEVMGHLNRLKGVNHVSFDIETETEQITCIGFSDRPNWAICVPFWFGGSGSLWSPQQEMEIWQAIKEILESETIKKIGHNGSYDIEYIRRNMSFDVRGYEFDTMLGFHCLYPELPKGLDYLVSIYTDHPYYKFGRKATTMDEHFRYNATDACLTYECYQHIRDELVSENLVNFYQQYMHSLIFPLLKMQLRGIKFDIELRSNLQKQYKEELESLQRTLDTAVGHQLNISSPKQMKEWLYGNGNFCLGLKAKSKKRKGSSEETISADEEALKALYKETSNEAIKTVLEMREKQKLLSTYLEVKLDEDKRIRCSYLISGTETGRLSSRQTARGTGTNLQNIPAGNIKRLFIADEGYCLINADLSQAEARVVAYLSGDERLIRVFESGGDIHRKNASNIFGILEKDVTDEQRQLAKRVVHACLPLGTDVLTPFGWKNIDGLTPGMPIAQFDIASSSIRFEPPKELFKYNSPDKLIEIRGRSAVQLVTENHKVPYFTNDKIKSCLAKEYKPSYRIPTSGYAQGLGEECSIVRLGVAIQADGNFSGNKVRFHLKKLRKVIRLRNILRNLKVTFIDTKYKDDTYGISFPIDDCMILFNNVLEKDKTFSWNILRYGADVLSTIVEESLLWDGCKKLTSQVYCSSIYKNVEILQACAHLSGWQGKIVKAERCYNLRLSKRRYSRVESVNNEEAISKEVYCVETTTGFFIIRQEGKISATGNSNYGMGYRTFSTQAQIPEANAKRLLNQYFASYPRIKEWHRKIADELKRRRQLTTPFGRRRIFFNRWNEQLVKEGLAFIPQSTVAEIVNQAIIELDKEGYELLLQVHDSIVLQAKKEDLYSTIERVRRALRKPVEINGRMLEIPVDIKIGQNWEEMKKPELNPASS